MTHALIDIVSKGGNLLLNVGPTAEGLIPKPSIERLADMGNWMAVNGEAIHGAKASPFGGTKWGRYTQKGKKVYAHVFEWPEEGLLTVAPEGIKISKVYLLSDKEKKPLKFEFASGGVVVELPKQAPDPIASVIVIERK